MTVFAPLAPATDCPSLIDQMAGTCPPAPPLHEVVGVGDPGTGGALDLVAEYLNSMGSHVPWYSTLTPGAVVALITITVAVAALIGWGVYTARSAK